MDRLLDGKGQAFDTRSIRVLCRCGKSHYKPFCDGTHIEIGFTDETEYTEIVENRVDNANENWKQDKEHSPEIKIIQNGPYQISR